MYRRNYRLYNRYGVTILILVEGSLQYNENENQFLIELKSQSLF